MSKKQDFIWAVRQTLLEQLEEKSVLLETDEYEYKKYIIENMSNEKLYILGLSLLSEYAGPQMAKLMTQRYKKRFANNPDLMARKIHKDTQEISSTFGRDNSLYKSLKKHELKANMASTQQAMHKAQKGQYWENLYKGVINYFQSPEGKKVLQYGGLALLGTAGLALAANYIYKRFFSAAAKACNHLPGPEKTLCMKKFEKQAIQKTIQKLQSDMKACNKTDNPQKCQINIQKQIQKWQGKLAKV